MPPNFLSHIRFPLKVKQTRSHVFIEDADRKARSTVAYDDRNTCSLEYASFVCRTLARALTDAHAGKEPEKKVDPKPLTDELTFKIEEWSNDDIHYQRTLAAFGNVGDAKSFLVIARKDYAHKNIKLRQRCRVIWEEGMK